MSAGRLSAFGRAGALPTRFSTGYSQLFQLPRTPSTTQVRGPRSFHRGAASGHYGDEMKIVALATDDDLTPKNARISATIHT